MGKTFRAFDPHQELLLPPSLDDWLPEDQLARFVHRPCPPACGGCPQKGDLQVEPPGGVFTEPDDHGLGRSLGGLTTKLHLTVEQAQKPMSLVITAGQRGDRQGVRLPREPHLPVQAWHPLHDPGEVRPDRQPQEARLPRWPATEFRQGRPQRAPRGGKRNQSPQAPPRGRTRYDKLAVRYEATVLVAAINEWL
ncbi:hypothetical protein [Streptomyces mirabilis]